STLFRFRVDFPVVESNLADSKPADSNIADSKPANADSKPANADSEPAITEDQITLWHARVGHVATSGLPHIAKVTTVPDSFRTAISGAYPDPGVCEPCLEGKQTRLPYPPSERGPLSPLEFIHTDSCHVPVPSLKGYKDFVTFTDEATRMSFVFYLLDKKP